MEKKEYPWAEYSKGLSLAYSIADQVFYPNGVQTHKQAIDRIRNANAINRMILEHKESNSINF